MRISKFAFGLAIATGLLAACGHEAGAQSAYGPGGLLVHPTAVVRPAGATDAGLSWFRQERPGIGNEWSPFTVVSGIDGRTEAGLQWVRRTTKGMSSNNGGLFVKHRLMDARPNSPAVAVVASHIGGPIALTSLALAGTWSPAGLPAGALVHGGIQWARRADLATNPTDVQPYVGLQWPVAPGLSVLAEAGPRFSFDPKARLGAGLMWTMPSGGQLAVGAVNIGRSDNPGLFVGVGYPIGGGKR